MPKLAKPKNKIAIVVHGGAGSDSEFIRKHQKEINKGIKDAVRAGYEVLKNKGSAVDAVEAAVNVLENDPHFNAGRGSALNANGEVQMCASIMDGKNFNSGAVAIIQNIKNPVSLAKSIMKNTEYIYLGNMGALLYAKSINTDLMPDSYFITEFQYDEFDKSRRENFKSVREVGHEQIKQKMHGTVGAVALDFDGNLAAATSTGGSPNAIPGRIRDSSMIGVGSYANNKTCAVSGTGDGEYLIRGVICHSVSEAIKYKRISLNEACKRVIKDNNNANGDIGIIAVDPKGNIAVEFNSERMLRGWRQGGNKIVTKIY
jgi:L-asparaginase / beta-aspartyl-peptidase